METLKKVVEIISEYSDVEKENIKMETTFEELSLDSLDTVDMVMACEDEFSVTLEMDDSIKTVGEIVKLIDSQKK